MFAIEISTLLMLSAVAGTAIVIHALRDVAARAVEIRRLLDACPEYREVRVTLREVTVRYDDGKVVPLRRRSMVSLPAPTSDRAAA